MVKIFDVVIFGNFQFLSKSRQFYSFKLCHIHPVVQFNLVIATTPLITSAIPMFIAKNVFQHLINNCNHLFFALFCPFNNPMSNLYCQHYYTTHIINNSTHIMPLNLSNNRHFLPINDLKKKHPNKINIKSTMSHDPKSSTPI